MSVREGKCSVERGAKRLPRAQAHTLRTTGFGKSNLPVHTHSHTSTLICDSIYITSRVSNAMMRFLTGHAFKDILIVPSMSGHIYHVKSHASHNCTMQLI